MDGCWMFLGDLWFFNNEYGTFALICQVSLSFEIKITDFYLPVQDMCRQSHEPHQSPFHKLKMKWDVRVKYIYIKHDKPPFINFVEIFNKFNAHQCPGNTTSSSVKVSIGIGGGDKATDGTWMGFFGEFWSEGSDDIWSLRIDGKYPGIEKNLNQKFTNLKSHQTSPCLPQMFQLSSCVTGSLSSNQPLWFNKCKRSTKKDIWHNNRFNHMENTLDICHDN